MKTIFNPLFKATRDDVYRFIGHAPRHTAGAVFRSGLSWALLAGGLLAAGFGAAPLEAERQEAPSEPRVLKEMVMVGQDVVVKTNEVGRDIVVICGSARIEGTVKGDLVVIAGSAQIEGRVEGDLAVIMGTAYLGPRAVVKGDVAIIAGPLKIEPTAAIGGESVVLVFGTQWLGLNWLKDWLGNGLLWFRPLPPRVPWVWGLTALCLAFYLLVALVFPRPLRACVQTLENRPLAAVLSGILAFLLVGPLMLLLLISVVGIVVIPFLICGLVVAFWFGKIALYQFAGQQIGRQTGWEGLQQPLIALIAGLALFCLLYTVPVLGFIVWGSAALLGIGAVLLAIAGSFRREPVEPVVYRAAVSSATVPPVVPTAPPVQPIAGDLILLPRAGFWTRLWATLLDLLLVGVMVVLFNLGRFGLLVWAVYHVWMWAWKGTTIGGIVLGLKIIRTDGRPLNLEVAIVRCLAAFLSGFALFLGFFWVGWDKERQSWHDKIAGTHIVKVPNGMSLL